MSSTSFRFRLERVRALRERSEDAAKQELASAMAGRQACIAAVDAAAERLAEARAVLHSELDHAGALLARQAYLERTESAHKAQLQELDRHETLVDVRRDELAAAARDRQALERLKEHRLADHMREAQRVEGLMLDEIATQSSYRSAA